MMTTSLTPNFLFAEYFHISLGLVGLYKARTKPKIQKASLGFNYKLVQVGAEARCMS